MSTRSVPVPASDAARWASNSSSGRWRLLSPFRGQQAAVDLIEIHSLSCQPKVGAARLSSGGSCCIFSNTVQNVAPLRVFAHLLPRSFSAQLHLIWALMSSHARRSTFSSLRRQGSDVRVKWASFDKDRFPCRLLNKSGSHSSIAYWDSKAAAFVVAYGSISEEHEVLDIEST